MHAGVSGLLLSLAIGLPAGLLGRCSPDDAVALGVLARERVALTATVSEIVTELPLAQGSPVRRGDVLVRLDDRIRRADLQLAQAELASVHQRQAVGAAQHEHAACDGLEQLGAQDDPLTHGFGAHREPAASPTRPASIAGQYMARDITRCI